MRSGLERSRPSEIPLLGDAAFPPSSLSPRRRHARLFVVLALAGVVTLSLFHHSSPAALEPLQQRYEAFKTAYLASGSTRDEDEVEYLERVEWSVEDRELRQYKWETPEVHSSLSGKLAELSTTQRRTYEWLTRTRAVSQSGTGIGLGASDPPRKIQPGRAAPTHDKDPRQSEGPGLFVSGSKAKYVDLVEEWKTGRPVEACDKGTWEESYAALHAGMLSGEREPWLMEYVCEVGGWCGGFADRMLGMIGTFFYSVISSRAYFLDWQHPTPPDLLFDSPYIDWSRPYNASSSTPIRGAPFRNSTFVDQRETLQAHDWNFDVLDPFFSTFEATKSAGKGSSWIRLASFNRGVTIRSFWYDQLDDRLEELGMKMQTAYSCLINYLLRPKPAVLAFITRYTSFFALPEVFTVGIQVRTGDGSMFFTDNDQNDVALHQQYFTCAAQLAKRHAHPSQKVIYYLVTDSKKLQQTALQAFPGQVVVTGLEASHDEIAAVVAEDKASSALVKRSADGFMRTIAESWIFAGTDFQIISARSGFGKIPTWLRGKDHTTVQLFNPHLDPIMTAHVRAAFGGELPPVPDCGKSEAIKSFADLAADWSLG